MKHTPVIFILLLIYTTFIRDGVTQDDTQWRLPKGAKARLSKGQINSIKYSPDGTQIVVGSPTGIWLYDVRTGAELALFTDHVPSAEPVAFSIDSKRLVGAAYDAILIWDVATGNLLISISGRKLQIKALRILEDGKTLLCENHNHSVGLWDITTASKIKHFNPEPSSRFGDVLRSAFGYKVTAAVLYLNKIQENGLYAVGYKNGKIRLMDASTGKHLKTFQGPEGYISQLVFSPDGSTLAVNTNDAPIRLWDVNTGKSLIDLTQKAKMWGILTFSKDGKTLACQRQSGEVELLDIATKTLRTTLGAGLDPPIHALAFSPDDSQTVAGVNPEGEIRVWDANTGEELSVFSTGHKQRLTALAFSPDSRTIASGHMNTVILWDALNFTQLSNGVDPKGWINALVFSPDGSAVSGIRGFAYNKNTRGQLIKEGVKSTLHSWHARTADKLSDLTVESSQGEAPMIPGVGGTAFSTVGGVGVSVFSQKGNMLATSLNSEQATEDYRFTVHVWDIPDRKLNLTLKGHTDKVNALAFTRDGKMLASGSDDGTIQLWDISIGLPTRSLPAGKTGALAFSSDGKILASANSTDSIQLWDVATGRQWTSLKSENGYITVLTFSTDGKTLASGDRYGTIQLWDIATGNVLTTYKGHVNWIKALVFSSDGKTLASGSSDGAMFLWHVPR